MSKWVITRDLLHEMDVREGLPADSCTPSEVGTRSRQTPLDLDAKSLRYAFRLLDDDKEVYYHGRSDSNDDFGPLDDFGLPNAGCTMIQYRVNGKWEVL